MEELDQAQFSQMIEGESNVAGPEFLEVINVDNTDSTSPDNPQILQEIVMEELSIDGICGVY